MSEDFSTFESGISPNPSYDESTGKMSDPELEGGKGGTRAPTIDEEIRHAVRKQKAEKDPVERFKQRAEKNGRTMESVLQHVTDIDNLAQVDRVAALRHVATKSLGMTPQEAGTYLYHGYSPTGMEQEAQNNAIAQSVAEFDHKHSDPLSKSLRPAAIKILKREDKRLGVCQSNAEMLDKAFALAWHDLPRNRLSRTVTDKLGERDQARDDWVKERTANLARRASKHIG